MRFAAALALAGGVLCALAQSLNSNFGTDGALCSVNTPSTVIVTKEVIIFTSMKATTTATSFSLPSSSGVYYFDVENGTTVWYDRIPPSEPALIVLQTSTVEVTEIPASSTTSMAGLITQITTATRFATTTVILTSSEVLSFSEADQSDAREPSTMTIFATTTQTALVDLVVHSATKLLLNNTSINTTSTQANETITVTELKQTTQLRTAHPAFTPPIFGWNVTSQPHYAAINNTTLLTVFGTINKFNVTLTNSTAT